MSEVHILRPTFGYLIREGKPLWDRPVRLLPHDELGLIDVDQNERGSIIFAVTPAGNEFAIPDAADDVEIIWQPTR